jgi:hypothetical protein
MDDEAPVARYDAAAGMLRLRLAGGEEVTIAGVGMDLAFWRGGGEQPASAPMWLSLEQADVLSKMIEYILQKVRISPTSRQVLEELSPQVAQLKDELEAAAAAAENDAPADVEYATE